MILSKYLIIQLKCRYNDSPLWQLIIIDEKTQFTIGKSITGDMNVIQSINK